MEMKLQVSEQEERTALDLDVSKVDLLLDVDEKPEFGKGLLLSFQHVFAMFGATILVPLILGMPVSVALFASGVGTLIYQVATNFKVPVYLGSFSHYTLLITHKKIWIY